jgi:type II secretion system protein G
MWRRIRGRTRREGFSLIELLIVVAIIGIIAAVAIPNLLSAMHKARQKRTMSDMKALGSAIESVGTDCVAYPPTDGDLGTDCATPGGIMVGLQKGGWWFQSPLICDGWRRALNYRGVGVTGGGTTDISDLNCLAVWSNPWATHYSLRSKGRDGIPDCDHAQWVAALNGYQPGGTCKAAGTCQGYASLDCDITFAGGQFIAFPEGMQK